MRDLLKRLERLETEALTAQPDPVRMVLHMVKADNGRPVPFDPMQAEVIGAQPRPSIKRDAGESIKAFEARALAHFSDASLIALA